MVRAMTRVQARRARQAHAGRALCAGIASVSTVLSLAILGGASLDDPELIVLAAFIGILAFVGWIHSERTDEHSIVCRIDDRLHLGGGFVAAFENAALDRMRPVAELDAYLMLQRAPRWRIRDAAVPHVVGFVALPIAALALLVGAIRHLDREAAGERELQQSARALAGKARGVLASTEGLAAEELAELIGSLDAARNASSGEETRDAMREVAQSADALAEAGPLRPELREMLDLLAFEAEAAAAGDETEPDGGAPAEGPSETAGASAPSGGVTELGASDLSDSSGLGSSANSSTASEDSASTNPSPAPGSSTTELPDLAPGTTAPRSARVTRWWPDTEAAIVEGWLAIVQGER